MGKKNDKSLLLIILTLTVLLWITTITTANYNIVVFVIELIVTAVITVIALLRVYMFRKGVREYINAVSSGMESLSSRQMSKFPVPLLVTGVRGEISWYNDAFFEKVLEGDEVYGLDIADIVGGDEAARLLGHSTTTVKINERVYKVNSFKTHGKKGNMRISLFYDETPYIKLLDLHETSKTGVLFIQIDGMDMMLRNAPESQKSEILMSVDREIENAVGQNGYIQKTATDKYIVFLQKNDINRLKEQKFPVLKAVRQMRFGERDGLTLSIGVGCDGKSISQCVEEAQAAIDMAVSRGGDQAVIKNGDDYEFFGGIKQAAQINSRVRTRVVAGTLKKMITACGNVLIMGHSYSDMDCFGAALSLCKTSRELKKQANIVLNKDKTMAGSLVDYVDGNEAYGDYIISPEKALQIVNKDTLLIVVDTHRRMTLECPELYDNAKTTVVIDHHRKAPDCIDNALLFYHDPSASSTCEMAAELIEYIGTGIVGKVEAECMLAGIMLDTHNFVLRTSSRTFEASAFLRSCGGDPVEVKRFFSDTMDTYRARAEIVSRAKLVWDCAISITDGNSAEVRMAASQAADELLTISGVSAAFVMYGENGAVNISARSYGNLNVQLIMEALGGGGHQTMAAAQLKDCSFETAAQRLVEAIRSVREQL